MLHTTRREGIEGTGVNRCAVEGDTADGGLLELVLALDKNDLIGGI